MFDAKVLKKNIKNTITTDVIPLFCLIFNNNCTGVHVIDAIEGVYVSDANAPESNNESSGQTDNFTETLQK